MWRALFCFVFITVIREGLSGFTNGAPCSVRNTALLDTLGHWRLPKDGVECVDITSMGKRTSMPPSLQITSSKTLYADHMHLAAIPDYALTVMPYLQLIDFSGNRMRRLSKDAFHSLANLRTLLLEDNRVFVPKRSPLLSSGCLKTLSLSNNKIRRVRANTFKELPSLTVLYLDRNRLIRIRPKVFEPLKYLKYLHLGNNQLKVMPAITLAAPRAIVIVKGNPFNRTEVIRR